MSIPYIRFGGVNVFFGKKPFIIKNKPKIKINIPKAFFAFIILSCFKYDFIRFANKIFIKSVKK